MFDMVLEKPLQQVPLSVDVGQLLVLKVYILMKMPAKKSLFIT